MNPDPLDSELAELKRQLASLAEENARLRAERDEFESQVYKLLPKASPEEEAAFRHELEHGQWHDGELVLRRLITELEGADGNQ